MSKHLIISALLMTAVSVCFSQQYGSFKDLRDGRVYKTVKIGSQEWMAENLSISRFRNGETIPEAKTAEEWRKAGKNKQPAWCYYNNDPMNGKRYGKLYNWYAVNDPRGLAPDGWHIPSDDEWTILTDYLGGAGTAGTKMKSKQGWFVERAPQFFNANGTNSSGFSGAPGGSRPHVMFFSIDSYAEWWSSTEYDTGSVWVRGLPYDYGEVHRHFRNKEGGFSVRCVQSNSTKNSNEQSKNENNFIFLEEDKPEPLPLKDKQIIQEKIDENKVYDEVDVDRKAEYFFGFLKWNEFISANIDPKNINKKCIKAGTYKAIIGFIVNTKGQIQYISPLSTNGCGIEEEAIRVINKAIKWEPAMKNGNYVTSYTKKIIEIKIEK